MGNSLDIKFPSSQNLYIFLQIVGLIGVSISALSLPGFMLIDAFIAKIFILLILTVFRSDCSLCLVIAGRGDMKPVMRRRMVWRTVR